MSRGPRCLARSAGALALAFAVSAGSPGAAGAREAGTESAGAALYRRDCASCHGVDGRGDGPAAAALSPPPPDLTKLQSSVPEIMRQIDGSRTVRAHGSAAMPVWGEVFEQSLIGEPHRRRTALLHVQVLADYVYRLRDAQPTPAAK